MAKEIWKGIDGYKYYKVNRKGDVKSVERSVPRCDGNLQNSREIILKQSTHKKGYKLVYLYKENGKRKTIKVHRLVAMAFVPNPENKPHVNHINGIKDDNRAENLEWCTNSENIQHSYTHLGRVGYGRNLTKEDVFKILSSTDKQIKIAEDFGVSNTTIRKIQQGKRYKKFYKEFKELNSKLP